MMHCSFWALSGKEIEKKINDFKSISTSGHRALLLEWLCCYKQLKNYIYLNRCQTLENSQNKTVILERKKTNKSDLCLMYVTLWCQLSGLTVQAKRNQSWAIWTGWRARSQVEGGREGSMCWKKYWGEDSTETEVQRTIVRSSWILTLLILYTWIGKHSMKCLG